MSQAQILARHLCSRVNRLFEAIKGTFIARSSITEEQKRKEMKYLIKIKSFIMMILKNPDNIFISAGRGGILNILPDKIYLQIAYYFKNRKFISFKKPTTFNEKLQWIKIYDRDDRYTIYSDKYLVRQYVKEQIGEKYLIPLIGVYGSTREICWEKLPNKFVLKCTHGSGCNIVCNDKLQFSENVLKSRLDKWIKRNYYWSAREWPYKNITPRIICEKLIESKDGKLPKDYKIFCFMGTAKFLFVASDRGNNTKFDFYDINWNKYKLRQHYDNSTKIIEKPKCWKEMKECAELLSKSIRHVRIDFYIDKNDNIYFGEMTFFHFGGFERFDPNIFDYKFGRYINVDNSTSRGKLTNEY